MSKSKSWCFVDRIGFHSTHEIHNAKCNVEGRRETGKDNRTTPKRTVKDRDMMVTKTTSQSQEPQQIVKASSHRYQLVLLTIVRDSGCSLSAALLHQNKELVYASVTLSWTWLSLLSSYHASSNIRCCFSAVPLPRIPILSILSDISRQRRSQGSSAIDTFSSDNQPKWKSPTGFTSSPKP
jgi:hypothetical protein